MNEENLPVIDEKKCRACGRCVLACPKKLFSLVKVEQPIYVACKSLVGGKKTRQTCPVGCIACRRCQKTCRFGAIEVIDNLAVIDYYKCTSCGECVEVCPMKTILTRIGAD
jgi:Fe-S-cluster-containing hydrogenase component 2